MGRTHRPLVLQALPAGTDDATAKLRIGRGVGGTPTERPKIVGSDDVLAASVHGREVERALDAPGPYVGHCEGRWRRLEHQIAVFAPDGRETGVEFVIHRSRGEHTDSTPQLL